MESPLAHALRRCAESCEQTLTTLGIQEAADTPATATVLLATAALRAAAEAEEQPRAGSDRTTALLVASTFAREAIEDVRRFGLDVPIHRCAATLERAANLCDAARRHA
jgi:hypothetical protein